MNNWYIVQTFSGFEHKVAETLKEAIKVKKLSDLHEKVHTSLQEAIKENKKE